jgi:hypothetical protein
MIVDVLSAEGRVSSPKQDARYPHRRPFDACCPVAGWRATTPLCVLRTPWGLCNVTQNRTPNPMHVGHELLMAAAVNICRALAGSLEIWAVRLGTAEDATWEGYQPARLVAFGQVSAGNAARSTSKICASSVVPLKDIEPLTTSILQRARRVGNGAGLRRRASCRWSVHRPGKLGNRADGQQSSTLVACQGELFSPKNSLGLDLDKF